jgi:predicted RNase H-like HicB family nuclease
VATGQTNEEAEQNMYEAIEMHVQGLVEDQVEIPKGLATAEYVVIKGVG